MTVPNWHAVGENLRYLTGAGVSSFFGECDHGAGYAAEMDELRAWVQASMMFNSSLNPSAPVDEFVLQLYGTVLNSGAQLTTAIAWSMRRFEFERWSARLMRRISP